MQLRGKANRIHSEKAGTYNLQSTDVNGKKHWLAENGKHAIWNLAKGQSENARWRIGHKKNLGKDVRGIFSPEDAATPYEATTWIAVLGEFKNNVIVGPILNGKN